MTERQRHDTQAGVTVDEDGLAGLASWGLTAEQAGRDLAAAMIEIVRRMNAPGVDQEMADEIASLGLGL